MHDEACPIYEDMIENMMMGHNFITQNFGVKPRIGWQIDPFGHSNTNARFFAEMGFDAWFFSRIDYQDKNKRMNDLEMEWVWRPNSQSLGNETQIFTHFTYEQYQPPPGFNFDPIDGGQSLWINNENSKDFNAAEQAKTLMDYLDVRAQHYLTDELFVLFGSDFQYQDASWNY